MFAFFEPKWSAGLPARAWVGGNRRPQGCSRIEGKCGLATILWAKDPGMNGSFGDVRADAYGRLYATKVDYSNNTYRAWIKLVRVA